MAGLEGVSPGGAAGGSNTARAIAAATAGAGPFLRTAATHLRNVSVVSSADYDVGLRSPGIDDVLLLSPVPFVCDNLAPDALPEPAMPIQQSANILRALWPAAQLAAPSADVVAELPPRARREGSSHYSRSTPTARRGPNGRQRAASGRRRVASATQCAPTASFSTHGVHAARLRRLFVHRRHRRRCRRRQAI